ncbi:MAG: hypothetical protein QOC70_1625 [Verrucomicrobiota bacterium]|jgi:hypothetical protein
MTTAPLSPSSAKLKFRLVGGAQPLILLRIAGSNFLRNYKVALDYPDETLSLFTP